MRHVICACAVVCLLDISLANVCYSPTFTLIIDNCYSCVNKSISWSKIHSVCKNVSSEVATLSSDYLLAITANLCSGIATTHVWLMLLSSEEGNMTRAKNVTDEKMSTNGTHSYCPALGLDVARVEQRPCYLQYPVLCQTNRKERLDQRRLAMKRGVRMSNSMIPGLVNVTNTATNVSQGSTTNSSTATCDPYKPNCTFTCPSKRFGFNCTNYCSLKCEKQVCHSLTGECTGGCVQGKSGLKCQIDCPNNCAEHMCDQKTSVCTKGCQTSFSGQRCLQQCYNCAGNRSCDQFSGMCHSGCAEGFVGTTCSKGVVGMTKDPVLLMIVLVVGGSSLFLMLMVAGIRYRVCKAHPVRSQESTRRNETVPET